MLSASSGCAPLAPSGVGSPSSCVASGTVAAWRGGAPLLAAHLLVDLVGVGRGLLAEGLEVVVFGLVGLGDLRFDLLVLFLVGFQHGRPLGLAVVVPLGGVLVHQPLGDGIAGAGAWLGRGVLRACFFDEFLLGLGELHVQLAGFRLGLFRALGVLEVLVHLFPAALLERVDPAGVVGEVVLALLLGRCVRRVGEVGLERCERRPLELAEEEGGGPGLEAWCGVVPWAGCCRCARGVDECRAARAALGVAPDAVAPLPVLAARGAGDVAPCLGSALVGASSGVCVPPLASMGCTRGPDGSDSHESGFRESDCKMYA